MLYTIDSLSPLKWCQDAEYIVRHKHGAHVAFLQYPPAGSARRPGKLGMCLFLQDLVTEHMRCSSCACDMTCTCYMLALCI
jgi:hypothetical protein